jgi:hypothetical protein
MARKKKKSRKKVVEKIKRLLQARSYPRLQMSIIVLSTAAAGFLFSFLLLSLGLKRMGIRYALAIFLAYLTFLFLIWLWLQLQKKRLEVDVEIDAEDVVDIIESIADGMPADTDFTGGSGSGGGFDIGVDFDLDELLVVIAALAAVLAGLIASLYIVFSSPTLFAEVLLDGVLSVGLYKRLRKLEQRHWLQSAIKKTWVPFLVVLLFFFIAGLIMQNYAPAADSIGDVWEKLVS